MFDGVGSARLVVGGAAEAVWRIAVARKPLSILDIVAYNRLLEIIPAVVSVFGVANLCISHAAHGAHIGLDALSLVVGDSNGSQVDCQVLL